MGHTVGYARVSSASSQSRVRERALRSNGAGAVFTDISASTRVAERPEWLFCLSYVRRGDTLLVHSLDRIASCEAMAVQTILDLEQRGIHLRSLREPDIDTADPNGRWWGWRGRFSSFEARRSRTRRRIGTAGFAATRRDVPR